MSRADNKREAGPDFYGLVMRKPKGRELAKSEVMGGNINHVPKLVIP